MLQQLNGDAPPEPQVLQPIPLVDEPDEWTSEETYRLVIWGCTLYRQESDLAMEIMRTNNDPVQRFHNLALAINKTADQCYLKWVAIKPMVKHIINQPDRYTVQDIEFNGEKPWSLRLVGRIDNFVDDEVKYPEYELIRPIYRCERCDTIMGGPSLHPDHQYHNERWIRYPQV